MWVGWCQPLCRYLASPQHGPLLAHPPLVESPEAVQAATRIQAVQRGRNVRREIVITKPLRVGRVVRAPGSRVESGRRSHRSLLGDDDNVTEAAPAHTGVWHPHPPPPPALVSSTHDCVGLLSFFSLRFGCSPGAASTAWNLGPPCAEEALLA